MSEQVEFVKEQMDRMDVRRDQVQVGDAIVHIRIAAEDIARIEDKEHIKGVLTKADYDAAVQNIRKIQEILDYARED